MRSEYNSEAPWRRFLAQSAFRVCLWGASEVSPTSEWRKRRQNAPRKWPSVQPIKIVLLIANGSPHMEAAICRSFQPIRVVLLIANGGRHLLARTAFRVGRRPTFLRDDSEMTLNAAQATYTLVDHPSTHGHREMWIGGATTSFWQVCQNYYSNSSNKMDNI